LSNSLVIVATTDQLDRSFAWTAITLLQPVLFRTKSQLPRSPRNQEAEKRRDHKTRDHRRQPYLRL